MTFYFGLIQKSRGNTEESQAKSEKWLHIFALVWSLVSSVIFYFAFPTPYLLIFIYLVLGIQFFFMAYCTGAIFFQYLKITLCTFFITFITAIITVIIIIIIIVVVVIIISPPSSLLLPPFITIHCYHHHQNHCTIAHYCCWYIYGNYMDSVRLRK